MARIRAPPPIGYRGPFKNMEHIYEVYRKTLMNTGQYRAYFTPRTYYGEPKKFSKTEYSREPLHSINSGERERKEQQHEIKPDKSNEVKTEIAKEDSKKIETSQEKESSQKIENKNESPETHNELSYEKSGLPNSYEVGQTDISSRKRPSPYYDKAEMRW